MNRPTKKTIGLALALAVGVLASGLVFASETLVRTPEAYREAVEAAKAGDTIILANGVWRDFEPVFTGTGAPDRPISLRAETPGKVVLSGESRLRIAGQHLVVSGLVFRDGYSPSGEVIAFRRDSEELAHHSRVTNVVIDHFNHPERAESDSWVVLYGTNNRFDHSHLVGKSNAGVTLAVRLNTPESRENHHRIDHNYFGPRPILGSNGGETLRIGTSHYSMYDSLTVVEHNWFERCDGEVEIISNKSGGNTFRNNVFHESRGTLTLRHGNGNTVEGNVFLGNGVPNTGGIRVINQQQVIRNNYLEGLTGYRFGAGLTVMNGVPDSPVNRYMPVADVVIEGNTLIDVDHVELAAGSDAERSAVPVRTTFRDNLLHDDLDRAVFGIHDDIGGIDFDANVATPAAAAQLDRGFRAGTFEMVRAKNGLLYPSDPAAGGAGVSRDLEVTPRTATGVDWYPKPALDGVKPGVAIPVSTGDDALFDAVEAAAPGAVLELAPGTHVVSKRLSINRPLVLRGAGTGERPVIRFERASLFEIDTGGSLVLERLEIDGSQAQDMAGNAVIRTRRGPMTGNFSLVVRDAAVRNLDVNHSFNFLSVEKGAFADRIILQDVEFENVTGNVLALDVELDDLGRYNAEVVEIVDSRFDVVGGAVLSVYRGGTDESTFGPRAQVRDNTFKDVGRDGRNRSGASLALHGAQRNEIVGNRFENSAPVKVLLTVGEPVTQIAENALENTPDMVIETWRRP